MASVRVHLLYRRSAAAADGSGKTYTQLVDDAAAALGLQHRCIALFRVSRADANELQKNATFVPAVKESLGAFDDVNPALFVRNEYVLLIEDAEGAAPAVAAAVPAAAPRPPTSAMALSCPPAVPMSSPTSSGDTGLDLGLVVVNLDAPLFAGSEIGDGEPDHAGASAHAAASFTSATDAISGAESAPLASRSYRVCSSQLVRETFAEGNYYGPATSCAPSWARPVHGADTAAQLYGAGGAALFGVSVLRCKPGLKLRSTAPCSAAFNGEITTAGDRRMFDAAGTYALLELHRNFFEEWEAGEAPHPTPPQAPSTVARVRPWRFFFSPPLGYSICGTAPVAWVMRAEWAGRVFLTAASQPFFIGSEEHASAVAALPPFSAGAPTHSEGGGGGAGGAAAFVDITLVAEAPVWMQKAGTSAASQHVWTTVAPVAVPGLAQCGLLTHGEAGACFIKLRLWESASAGHTKRIVRAYTAYARAWRAAMGGADPPPPSLLPASLLFGYAQLAVAMPFVGGGGGGGVVRPATEEELRTPGAVASAVAEAVAWLGRQDLLHLDVRPPNVLVVGAGGSAAPAHAGTKRPHPDTAEPPPAVLSVVLVDYDDLRLVPGLGARLRSGGVAALADAFSADDGSGVVNNVPPKAFEGVRGALEHLHPTPP